MKTNITTNYAGHTKGDLLAEASLRGIPGLTDEDTKPDIIAALELSDEQEAPKGSETDQPKPPLPPIKASPIPQVPKKELESVIREDAAPSDDFYTDGSFVMRKGAHVGEEFALCIHAPDTYGNTHSLKNSEHFWQGKEEEFRVAFEKK